MAPKTPTIADHLTSRGISRRQFLKFCGVISATLSLPAHQTFYIAQTLAAASRKPLIWLEFQSCTGDSEAFLRAHDPTVRSVIFDIISLNYHETFMAPSGKMAEKSLQDTITQQRGQYICVVEGAIPKKDGGVYCTIGGRTALSIVEEVTSAALLNIAAGSCAYDGGLPIAQPNPTGAVGLQTAVPTVPNLLNMPGCSLNGVNLVAAIVHYITYNTLPARDSQNRPLFAYQNEIHENQHCERYKYYSAKQFVRQWGDEGHRKGWCLLRMGCRGPKTKTNCYTRNWNSNTNWPIRAGHNCIGCVNQTFWDQMTPFYTRK